MEEKKTKKTLPLVFQSNISYSIVIPDLVERKIRLLCSQIHNIEWSGILFYTYSGSFDTNDLKIECKDIYQMDIGNGSYTEYTINPDVASYMLDHDLMGCYIGHIHSHHNMAAFFSGTDTKELNDGGMDTNHFVSLIVNNSGKYVAGITRKVTSTRNITENIEYNSFDDAIKTECRSYVENSDYIEWYKLNIEGGYTTIPFEEEMLNRIKEIKEAKNKDSLEKIHSKYMYEEYDYINKYNPKPSTYIKNTEKDKQGSLPFDYSLETDIPYGKVHIKPSLIKSLARQLITCCVIIPNESTVDLNKWILSMNKLYTERFENINTFRDFAANHVDFLINNAYDDTLSKKYDATDMVCLVAYDLMMELSNYPKNPWLEVYIELLNDNIL